MMLFTTGLFIILCTLNNATNNVFSRLPSDATAVILESLSLTDLISLRKTKNRNLAELIDNSDNKLTQWKSVGNFVSFINESMCSLHSTHILFDKLLQKINYNHHEQETKMMEKIISKLVINDKLSLNSKIKIADKLFNISGMAKPETKYEYQNLKPLRIMQQMMDITIDPILMNEHLWFLIPIKLREMLEFGYNEMKKTNKKYNVYTNFAFCFLDWLMDSDKIIEFEKKWEIIDIWFSVEHITFIRDFLNRNIPFLCNESKRNILEIIIDYIMRNGVCDDSYNLLVDTCHKSDMSLIINLIITSQHFYHSNSCNLLKMMLHSKWMDFKEMEWSLNDNKIEKKQNAKDQDIGDTRIRKIKKYLLRIQSQNEINESSQNQTDIQKATDSAQTLQDLDKLRKILKSENNQTIPDSECSKMVNRIYKNEQVNAPKPVKCAFDEFNGIDGISHDHGQNINVKSTPNDCCCATM